MRPDVVVVVAPKGQRSARFAQAFKNLLVQALISQTAVERLDEAILLRLTGVDVMPIDVVIARPFQDGFAGKLSAVVTDYTSGLAVNRIPPVRAAFSA